MSKIYEALQRAGAERQSAKLSVIPKPSATPPAKVTPLTPGLPSRLSRTHPFELEFEREMANIFHPMISALPESRGTLMFVAAHPDAGTSTVARAFGAFSAAAGYRTLLLDADRENPEQAARFGVQPGRDVEEVIVEQTPLEEAILPVGNSPLFVATLSHSPGQSPFRAGLTRTTHLFDTLRAQFDLVIVDVPSPRSSPESLMLSKQVDGVVLIVEANATNLPQARRAKEEIESGGGKFVGLIFNKREFFIPDWIYRNL